MADEVKLPTAEDIRRLPRWARVAFAARCARRALPLFREVWPNALVEYIEAVEHAVLVAEAAGAGATYLAEQAAAAAAYADSIAAADDRAAAAAAAATAAARAATVATARAATVATAARAAAAAADSVAAAAAAAAAYADVATRGCAVSSIAKDFQSVLRLAQVEQWTDQTPVSPEVFGPLDEPVAAPPPAPPQLEQDPEVEFALRAAAEPGVSAEVVARHVVAVFQALNEYTLAKYGTRLTKDQFRRLVYAHSGARV